MRLDFRARLLASSLLLGIAGPAWAQTADTTPADFFSNSRLTSEASVEAPDILRLSLALGLSPCLTPADFAGAWLNHHHLNASQG